MKIVIVSNSAAPSKNASSLQIARMCDSLVDLKNNVTLILPNTGNSKNYHKFYNLRNKFKILRLKLFKKFPIGIKYYLFAFISTLKILKIRPDLVITRNFFLSVILSFFSIKHILEVHDSLEIEGRVIRILQKNLNFLNHNNLIKIVSTTNTLKKYYVNKCGVNYSKIKVLHNASPLIPKKKPSFLSKRKFNIGFFGTIYKSRGLNLFIKLSKINNNNYFVYGGSKKDIAELRKKYKNKNLFLKHYVPQAELSTALEKMDICLLPYRDKITVAGDVGNMANFTSPLKIFDFMKMGKIIIASEIKVLKEILNNKNSILIKNYKDYREWVKAINKIKNNPSKQILLRKNAFKFANERDAKWRAKELLKI